MNRVQGEFDLRHEARAIFDVALRSVDAGKAVHDAVRLDGPRLTIKDTTIDLEQSGRRVYAVAVGKAAFPMARALDEVLKHRLAEGLVVGQALHQTSSELTHPVQELTMRWRQIDGAHPLPAEQSLVAAHSAFELLQRANDEHALVLFLISGGGSSMIEWPRDDSITLDDLRTANQTLVSCGASISEINAVRGALSAVKAGKLAARAPNADQITLIISDTAKGQESIVASGPTLDPPADAPDPVDVIARNQLAQHLPASILHAVHLSRETHKRNVHDSLRKHYVLLDNETAITAATDEALRRGFVAEFALDISEQPIAEGCSMLLARVSELHSRVPNSNGAVCLISGGEFSCPVRGNGVGGRNAETVFRCAIELAETNPHNAANVKIAQVAVLSAGTDGIDGNSPAAGAVANEKTIERAVTRGLDSKDYLLRSDAYSFFDAFGDTIMTGPTGTNVRDVRIVLAHRS